LTFQFDDHGTGRIAFIRLDGTITWLAEHVGGETIGRPYASGSFSVSGQGLVAYSHGTPERPADVAVAGFGLKATPLTSLNEDLLAHKKLSSVEEFRYESSADGRQIHAWLVKPPGFEPDKKYPLLLEIHGGPFANYGSRFSAEMQLYAAAGYVVLYCNPRGSTSYGEEFGNLIHHNYPGQDYDDLMSGVDAVIRQG
jgi:acylaminoacyl-peptidase